MPMATHAAPITRPMPRRSSFAGDRLSIAAVAAILSIIVALAAFTTTQPGAQLLRAIGVRAGWISRPAPPTPSHRVGSIISVPWGGQTCDVQLFDNNNGVVYGQGHADCDLLLPRQDVVSLPRVRNTSRIEAIARTFQK